jgi:integrase
LLKVARGERLETLYVVMLSIGIRPGEAFALTWSSVDLDEGLITIRQALSRGPGGNVISEGKTGKKGWRTINLPPPVVKSLRANPWQEHDLVFCTPLGHRSILITTEERLPN